MLKQYFSNNNKIVNNTYDQLNRLTTRSIQTSTWVLWATSETYTYDELGRLTNWNDNLNNSVSFNYDSLNRLIFETNNNENTNYTYDINSNITSINNTNYAYDIANRLQTVTNWTESIANYTFDSLTQIKQTLWNWVITNYSYDELLRLSTLWNYNYTYNTQWNITNDWKDSYTYDILWRLTSVNYDKVNTPGYNWDKIERFYYDNVWNRTNQENYTLKETSTETCSDETVVEDITLPNGKTKTVEKKVRKCETAITQTEKQKNTLAYNTNQLNQYTKLQNLNKNGEVKKEFTYNYDKNWNLTKDDINQYFYYYKNTCPVFSGRLVKVIQNEVIKVDENGNIIETIPEKEIVKYSYDVLGRRTTKQTQEEKINYIYAWQNAIQENIYTQSWTTLTLTEKPETYSWLISWYVYDDNNNNWIQETYEKLMAWWKVCIDSNNNWTCEENSEPFILTNNDWYYEFNWLPKWLYKIIEIPHTNWNITSPTSLYYSVNLWVWQTIWNKNFGNYKYKGNNK